MQRKLIRTVSIAQRDEGLKIEEILQDRFYIIQCKLNGFCIQSQPRSYKLQEGDSILLTGNVRQGNSLNQLWMFSKVGKQYEIIHVKTDLVLTIDDFEARLQVGKQKQNQKFEVYNKNGYVRIKDYSGSFLHIDGILEPVDYSQRDQTQMFRLNTCGLFELPSLRETIFILTNNKDKSLDLVNAARENETEISLFNKNFRMNQRWKFILLNEKQKNKSESVSVHIVSALTNMFVVFHKKSEGLIQASYPEEWIIESTEIKEYVYIRHYKHKQYLCYDSQLNKIFFSQTKVINVSKWYIQNSQEGFHSKKNIPRTNTI